MGRPGPVPGVVLANSNAIGSCPVCLRVATAMDVLFCTSCGRWQKLHNGSMRYCCPMTGDAWCGECYSNTKGRSNVRGHMGYRRPSPPRESRCMPLRIPSANGKSSLPAVPASSSTVFLRDYANILEFLCSLSGEGGSKREPGTLSLKTRDGKWTLRVADPTGKVYCYVTDDDLDSALSTLERGLGDGSLDWRRDTFDKGRK